MRSHPESSQQGAQNHIAAIIKAAPHQKGGAKFQVLIVFFQHKATYVNVMFCFSEFV